MQKKYLSTFLSVAVVFLLFTACEKEAIQSTPEEAVVLDEMQQASRYLNANATDLPFAVLEINHETNHVKGFFIDKTANLRQIEVADAPYLGLDQLTLDNYFMGRLHGTSKIVAEISPVEVAAQLKSTVRLLPHDNFTSTEATTSKIFLLLRENMDGTSHRDCVDSENSLTGSANKVVLAASGQVNYKATSAEEKALVTWLQSFEALIDN